MEYAPGCNDPGYGCARVSNQFFDCDPTTGSGCWGVNLQPCATFQCVDADNDTYYAYNAQTCPHGNDCDDTNRRINPGAVEDCHDTELDDEDCDGLRNCEDMGTCGTPEPGGGCDEQCDQDNDGFYRPSCGGMDCADDCEECTPHGYGEMGGSAPNACDDGLDNDSDCDTDCDDDDCSLEEPCVDPTPTPVPLPSPTPGGCNGWPFPDGTCLPGFFPSGGLCQRSATFMQNCFEGGGYDFDSCTCMGGCGNGGSCSPIAVDVLGNGFSLTNANNGVNFNLDNTGSAERIGWTSIGSDDAWLALDRNHDGLIDKGKELFGDVTPQDPPAVGQERNGFRALALYDGFGWGGNGDGKITRHDAIFDRLRLWQDANHNGVSEAGELFGLRDLGLRSIDLDYVQSPRVDAHGNQFKYRSRVRDVNNEQLGRWAWDVFLVVQH